MRVHQYGLRTGKKVVFAVAPLMVLMLLCEIGLRLAGHGVSGTIDGRATHFSEEVYPSTYDRSLGYIPQPNSSHRHLWGKTITLGADGIRSNGRRRRLGDLPILAVGDSFTFGDEVGDNETWPAHLEILLGRTVLNAGVFGYGLDQAVLRAEELVTSYSPSVLIVSFTPADIARCEMAVYYSYKPYFEVQFKRLVLRRDHMPEALPAASPFKRVLRHSVLAHSLLSRVAPRWWLQTFREDRVHRQGLQVACLLMDRIARLAQKERLKVLVVGQPEAPIVLQYPGQDTLVEKVLTCSEYRGLVSLNLVREYRLLLAADPEIQRRFFNAEGVHMTDEGNGWVAGELERILREYFFDG
jgi:hypothetical protein